MKKVIDKCLYDTEKSTKIAGFSFSNVNEFNYVSESLYQSPGGQFFVAGEGGAKTKYSRNVGNGPTTGGVDIILLTEGAAHEWLEDHQYHIDENMIEIYKEYFPETLKNE